MFYSILQSSPYGIQVADVDGVKTVMVSIATDGERVVAVISRLESFPFADDEDTDTHEFSFVIAVFSHDGNHENFETMDRDMAVPYIPHDIRNEVMNVVSESAKTLIQQEKPEQIYMVTKDRNLPEKAIRKYDILMDALYEAGYEVRGEGTDAMGRRFWTMQPIVG